MSGLFDPGTRRCARRWFLAWGCQTGPHAAPALAPRSGPRAGASDVILVPHAQAANRNARQETASRGSEDAPIETYIARGRYCGHGETATTEADKLGCLQGCQESHNGSALSRRQTRKPLSRRPLKSSKPRHGACTQCSGDSKCSAPSGPDDARHWAALLGGIACGQSVFSSSPSTADVGI